MMKRFVLAGGTMLVAAAALALAPAGAEVEGVPSIKEVMVKLHKGANAPLGKIGGALKSDTPDWDAVQKLTKDFVILGASLEKNDPPKGDAASWKTLADQYYADSKALDDAAQAKDRDAAIAAQKKLGGSCKACHTAHKASKKG